MVKMVMMITMIKMETKIMKETKIKERKSDEETKSKGKNRRNVVQIDGSKTGRSKHIIGRVQIYESKYTGPNRWFQICEPHIFK